MSKNDLQEHIADTLHRNFGILLDDLSKHAGKGEPPKYVSADEVERMLDSCAANLAQTIPELDRAADDARADYAERLDRYERALTRIANDDTIETDADGRVIGTTTMRRIATEALRSRLTAP